MCCPSLSPKALSPGDEGAFWEALTEHREGEVPRSQPGSCPARAAVVVELEYTLKRCSPRAEFTDAPEAEGWPYT